MKEWNLAQPRLGWFPWGPIVSSLSTGSNLLKIWGNNFEKDNVYMHLKIKNICLKICVEIHISEKMYRNMCNIV